MGHDSTKILMGATQSSFRSVTNEKGSIAAGLGVRLKSDKTLSLTKADGALMGISLGKDLSDTDKTAIVRRGEKVPVLVASGFTPTVGAQVSIDDATGRCAPASSSATAVNGYYADSKKTAILEDGTEDAYGAVHINFPGGL